MKEGFQTASVREGGSVLVHAVADAAEVAQVHPDEKRFADNKFVIDKTPVAGIRAVVAVVAHHEIAAFGHFAGKGTAVFGILAKLFQSAALIIFLRHQYVEVTQQSFGIERRLAFIQKDVEVFTV